MRFYEPLKSVYRLHTKIQLAKPLEGANPGKMRVFIADGVCDGEASEVAVTIPEYKTIWNLDVVECKSHCRFMLIDIESGYRNGLYHM